jgi:hypothetical protein
MDSAYLYYLGLDLGQARDYSALAIIEEQLYVGEAWASEILHQPDYQKGLSAGWISPAAITPYQTGLALRLSHEHGRPAEGGLPGAQKRPCNGNAGSLAERALAGGLGAA